MAKELNWEYTRTWRMHYVDDGERYKRYGKEHSACRLFEIRDLTPYGYVRQCHKDGYALYVKGKKVKHAQTVKELKLFAGKLAPRYHKAGTYIYVDPRTGRIVA